MLFNSLTFVVFYVIVTTLYWSIGGWNARKNLLVVASYIFYGGWNPPFAALLFSTTAMDFWLGRQIAKATNHKKRWLVASVCMNLSMLGFFKYGNFLLQNFQWLLARVGIIYQPPHLDILLPVGISFYTFHSLSYTLDIYRGVLQPTRSLRDFVLAVSFFPQLVAGPIVRAGDFLPQLVHPPRLKTNQFLWGLALMTLGLFEKIVLADTLLSASDDRVFGYAGPLAALDSWAGVLAFAGQIFCDFEGYSLTAIGDALVLGFLASLAHLAFNFFARLSLHSAGRKSGPPVSHGTQSRDRDVSRRSLAWRGVDVCRLGSAPRLLFGALIFRFRSQSIVTFITIR